MAEVLQANLRQDLGTARSRQLRRGGRIPAILYGHGEQNVCLSVPADQLAAALRHGSKLVQLQGDVVDSALIKEVQWDVFGAEVLHLDLTRVSASERVEVTVGIELRGAAPGVQAGGQLLHAAHEVRIRCKAASIPERIEFKINDLQLGQTLTLADLRLPDEVELMDDPAAILVQCVTPQAELEEGLPAGGEVSEPEVIGRKAEQEDEG
ncbi:MAG: 50S ribosomal protein L25 [Pirellulaceae bacterium]|nr:50S ribosomal protein L25 [Pirellulaceae bacterium]